MNYNVITYSEEYKSILWTPQKTGSSHATFIFTHFDFVTEFFGKENSKLLKSKPSNLITHHHNCTITDELSDYDVICTSRNPYARLISGFFYLTNIEHKEFSVENFREFFSNQITKPTILYDGFHGYQKIPNYFLRTERLYEDYQKIPFVRDSKLNQCGLLYDLCNKKINKNRDSAPTKDFFTMDMINYLYDNFRNVFDIDGYEKDCYKEFN